MAKRSPVSIVFSNVTLRVGGKWVLTGVNWRIAPGQHWVIQGPNGAGKTTLAKALLGEVAVVRGRVERSPSGNKASGPVMAMVSPEQVHRWHQREQLLSEMRHFSGRVDEATSGLQILGGEFGSEGLGSMPEPESGAVPELPGLTHLLAKPLEALSSGEIRKLLLARALCRDPQMLILDEPFNNLDAASCADLSAVMQHLMARGVQLILITHHTRDVPPGFTHYLRLEQGRVAAKGPLAMDRWQADPKSGPAESANARPQGTQPGEPPLVDMQDVCVRYGKTLVLDHICWSVGPGEHWALIGPNGAGKTTLLKLITGDQLQGYANRISLFGHQKGGGESVWQIKKHIGHVSDELHARYQTKVTSRDVISSGFFDSVGLYRRCTEKQKQTVDSWIASLDLVPLAGERFDRLSFGQQRLILIARAMVKNPLLLILDEPCSGLDKTHRRKVLDLVESLAAGGTTQLLFVTHRQEELPACITHRLYLEEGKIKGFDFS